MDEQERTSRRGGRQPTPPLLLTSRPGSVFEMPADPPLFDFGSVTRMLRRRLGLIVLITAVCVGIAAFLDSLVSTTYTASTRILLDEEAVNSFGNDDVFTDLKLTNPVVESQMQLMSSPYLLAIVVADLDLSNNPTFMNPPQTAMAARLSGLRSAIFPAGDVLPAPTEAELFQAAVERLGDNLGVTRNAQTLVIRLQFTSTSPELAAQIVDAVANTYITDRLRSRQQTADRAAEWFDQTIADLNARAVEVEQQLERLRQGGTTALDASETAATLQSARQTLQAAIETRSRAQSEVLRYKTLVESGRGLRGVPSNIGADALSILADEAKRARADLAAALAAETRDEAEIARLGARIESVELAGADLINDLLAEAEARLIEAEDAVTAAQTAFDAARDASAGDLTNSIEVELKSLEGEARIYRDLQARYLESYLNTVQQQSFPSTEAAIIETAVPPDVPDGPSLQQIGILAALIGLSAGAVGAFIAEASDGTIRTTAQLRKSSKAPLLGLLPTGSDTPVKAVAGAAPQKFPIIKPPSRQLEASEAVIALPENRVALTKFAPQLYATITDPLSIFSETMRRVNVEAENILALIPPERTIPAKTVGFISDEASDGRSIAAANYAEMLAIGGGRTLLIDLDWTGLFLTERITPAAHVGLAELAVGGGDIAPEQAFWYDERTSLYFLPNRSMNKDAKLDPSAFDQARLKAIVRALAATFDNIVLDLSPMTVSSDTAALSDVVLGYVAVADWGKTKSSVLARELHRAAIWPPKLLGTLLNGVSQHELDKYETAA